MLPAEKKDTGSLQWHSCRALCYNRLTFFWLLLNQIYSADRAWQSLSANKEALAHAVLASQLRTAGWGTEAARCSLAASTCCQQEGKRGTWELMQGESFDLKAQGNRNNRHSPWHFLSRGRHSAHRAGNLTSLACLTHKHMKACDKFHMKRKTVFLIT